MSDWNTDGFAKTEDLHQTVLDSFAAAIQAALHGADLDARVYERLPVLLGTETVEPDLLICSSEQVTNAGCTGIPDWIVEVTSPETASDAFEKKPHRYLGAGVRECWIVDPDAGQVITYCAMKDHFHTHIYRFGDTIPVDAFSGITVDTSRAIRSAVPRRTLPPQADAIDEIC